MNLLIIGSGAREHTFAWKIRNSKHNVNIFMTNPNAACLKIVTPISIDISNLDSIKQSIISYSISFVLVGPEIPLIQGITDFITNDPELI